MKNKIALLISVLLLPAAVQGRTLSLEECLELSRTENVTVKNAELDIASAKAQKQEAFTKYLPSVSAHAYGFAAINPLVSITLEDVLGGTDAANMLRYYAGTVAGLSGMNDSWSLMKNGYTFGVSLIQPVFAGGRIVNGNALAKLDVSAAQLKRDLAIRTNENDVREKYWTVVSLQEKMEALLQAEELLDAIEKDVSSALGAGLATESDLLRVNIKKKELESTKKKLSGGIRLAKMDLMNLIGMDYEFLRLDETTFAEPSDELLSPDNYRRDESAMVLKMTETQLLGLSVEAKQLEKKMAVGENLPQIGIGAVAGNSKLVGDPASNAAVVATVKIPLSDWGAGSRKIARCSNEIEKARNEKEYLDKQLLLSLRKEWVDLECAWEQVLVQESSVELSERSLSELNAGYEAGTQTLSEVLKAQSELSAARSTLIDSRIEYRRALSLWSSHE